MFVAVALLVTSVMAVTSGDYGISQDESTHRVHGQILLDYFRGVSDRALWEPLNADGSFPGTAGAYTAFDDPAWRGLNIYAGTFDLLCEAVDRYVPTGLGPYEVRHLLGGLLGALTIVMTGHLAHALDGKLGDRHAGAPLRGAHAAPGRPRDDQSEGRALRGIVHLRSRAASRGRSQAATGAALASRRSWP